MPFTTPGVCVDLHGHEGTLIAPLSYQGAIDHWTIPSGFKTDFATVPWFVQSLIPRTGTWTLAAVLHDWHCIGLARGTCPISARDADGVFRRVLREEGVGVVRRWVMWTGVRWGALANPSRRAGWLKDAPLTLGVTAVILAALAAAIWGLHELFHLITD